MEVVDPDLVEVMRSCSTVSYTHRDVYKRQVCGDGDPADVLVILPLPLVPGSVIRCRPVGVLKMSDEAGSDEKILAVPVDKVFNGYSHIDDIAKVSKPVSYTHLDVYKRQ